MSHQLKIDNLKVYNLTKLFDLSVSDKANINYACINNAYIDGKINVNDEVIANTISTQKVNAEDSIITKYLNANELTVCSKAIFEDIKSDGDTILNNLKVLGDNCYIKDLTIDSIKGQSINIGNCNSIVNITGKLNAKFDQTLILNNSNNKSINDCGIIISNNGLVIGYIKGNCDNNWIIKSPNMAKGEIIATKGMIEELKNNFDLSFNNLSSINSDISLTIFSNKILSIDTSINLLNTTYTNNKILTDTSINRLNTLYSAINSCNTSGVSVVTDTSINLLNTLYNSIITAYTSNKTITDTSINLLNTLYNSINTAYMSNKSITDTSINTLYTSIGIGSTTTVNFAAYIDNKTLTDTSINTLYTTYANNKTLTDTSVNLLNTLYGSISTSTSNVTLSTYTSNKTLTDTSINTLSSNVTALDISAENVDYNFNNYLNDFINPTILKDNNTSPHILTNNNIEVVINTTENCFDIGTGNTNIINYGPAKLESHSSYTYRKITTTTLGLGSGTGLGAGSGYVTITTIAWY